MIAAYMSSPRALRLLATPPTTALDMPLRLLATLLAIALLLASDATAAKPARFEVEKNTIEIKEPASIAGTYEAGIGDVSGQRWCSCCSCPGKGAMSAQQAQLLPRPSFFPGS